MQRVLLSFTNTLGGVSRSELEAIASLVNGLPLLSTIDVSTQQRNYDLFRSSENPSLLPCLIRAVAEGVAASSSLHSARGGGHVRALALRGKLVTWPVDTEARVGAVAPALRELPEGWAEGLGIPSSAAGATAAAAAAATSAATTAASTSISPSRSYELGFDVALASSALALLAKNSPIEKLALDIRFWQPRERGEVPPRSAAEAAAHRAAPRTLGALLHPLANQLVDLSVGSEQWRLATRGGFAREGASAPLAPSSLSAVSPG